MSWLDFLKSFLPDVNLTVIFQDNRNQDNRKIIIKDSEIVIGKKKITKKKTVEEFYKAIQANSKDDSLPFQLVHKDLIDDFIDYEKLYVTSKEDLKLLRQLLEVNQIECVLMARRLAIAYNENRPRREIEDLTQQLEKNYPGDGKKVYHLISGGYFDELIVPMAKLYLEKNKHAEFQKLYSDILRFFPLAIFVGRHSTITKIKSDLNKRINMRDVPFIRLHAMGKANITKAEKAIDSLSSEFKITVKRYKSKSGIKAEVIEVTR